MYLLYGITAIFGLATLTLATLAVVAWRSADLQAPQRTWTAVAPIVFAAAVTAAIFACCLLADHAALQARDWIWPGDHPGRGGD